MSDVLQDRIELANLWTVVAYCQNSDLQPILREVRDRLLRMSDPTRVEEYVDVIRRARDRQIGLRRSEFDDPLDATIAMHRVNGGPIGWIEFTALLTGGGKTMAAQRSEPDPGFVATGETLKRWIPALKKVLSQAVRPLNRNDISTGISATVSRPPSRNDVTYLLHYLWSIGDVEPKDIAGRGKVVQGWVLVESATPTVTVAPAIAATKMKIPEYPRDWTAWISTELYAVPDRRLTVVELCQRARELAGKDVDLVTIRNQADRYNGVVHDTTVDGPPIFRVENYGGEAAGRPPPGPRIDPFAK